MKLIAPWQNYRKMVNALFAKDPDISVGEIYSPAGNYKQDFVFDISVYTDKKYSALLKALPSQAEFGKVILGINVKREVQEHDCQELEWYKDLFEGNPLFMDVRKVQDPAGAVHGYVRFHPEVLQFFHDDLSDYKGNWSGLAQDIARNIFKQQPMVHFCTADLHEYDEE